MNFHHHTAWGHRCESPFLRSIDARCLLLCTCFFLCVVSLFPKGKLILLFGLGTGVFALAEQSGVGTGALLLRAAVVLPFVTLPVLLSPMAGALSWEAAVSEAAILGARAWISASCVVLMLCIRPLASLCAAAERMGVPSLLTSTVLLCERYWALLQRRVLSLLVAARLRGLGDARLGRQRRALSAMLATLLLQSLGRSERVYAAMKARGFAGTLLRLDVGVWRRADTLVLMLWALWCGCWLLWARGWA